MDQDVGSSVNTRFCEYPRIICVGDEADDCKLSGYIYIHTHINDRTGGIILLSSKSINTAFIIIIALFLQLGYMSLEHDTLRALSLY